MTKAKIVEKFEFNAASMDKAKTVLAKYPEEKKKSAVIPFLDIAQRQNDGWLSQGAIEYVADFLSVPVIKVWEVASFYTMFNLKPVGKNLVQFCRTTPCWLRGIDDITESCKKKLGVGLGETTEDGEFTLLEVECLGACVNAPVVQINDNYYEDLSVEEFENIIDALKEGKDVVVGSVTGRNCSAPVGELTSLKGEGQDAS